MIFFNFEKKRMKVDYHNASKMNKAEFTIAVGQPWEV